VSWVGHVACMEEIRHVFILVVRNSGREKLFGKLKTSCENNMEINLEETGREDVDWIQVAVDRVL